MNLPIRRKEKSPGKTYDNERYIPVIRCSICTGEQVAGFKDKTTGKIEDIMLIGNEQDLREFRKKYGITQTIDKVY